MQCRVVHIWFPSSQSEVITIMSLTATSLALLLIAVFPAVNCRYTLQIRPVQFSNPDNIQYDGGCCDVFCIDACELYFFFCIRNHGTTPTASTTSCWFTIQTRSNVAANIYNFPISGALYPGAQVNTPITFNGDNAWPGSFQLLVDTYDFDPLNTDDYIDRFISNQVIGPTAEWSSDITVTGHSTNVVTFKFQFKVACQTNYYSSDCTVYCAPQDNVDGHYDCNAQGQKVCKSGYTNPSTDCITPICSSGCSLQNGYCNVPNECLCNSGWTSPTCTQCIPLSGCSTDHGYCTQANECICNTGYGGTLCTEDNDVCGHQEPCMHGATCTNTSPDNHRCDCAPGYTGSNCQTEENECSPNPCQNGGNCIDQVNNYQCECAPGWTGVNCQTEINECESNPCENNGTCNDLINDYSCDCTNGFIGPNCEGHVCNSSSPCNNNGTCIQVFDDSTGYRCNCVSGYIGVNCTDEINECDPDPCVNGTCTDLFDNYVCTCTPGFTGKNCNYDIDNCIGSLCSPNSVCDDGINTYTCICNLGYTGQYCETEIDLCLSQPCLNGGTCNNYPGYYQCNCLLGFTDPNCETNIDDCNPNPCQNGGTCEDMVNDFVCTCPDIYTDLTCTTVISACNSNPCPPPNECVDDLNSTNRYYCQFCAENICEIIDPGQITGSPTPTAVPPPDESGLYAGLIAGGSIILLCLICLMLVFCCLIRRKKMKRYIPPINDTRPSSFTNNPTYMPPHVITSPTSTLERPTSPSNMIKRKLESLKRPVSPSRQGYQHLADVSMDNALTQTGMYDSLLGHESEEERSTVIGNPYVLDHSEYHNFSQSKHDKVIYSTIEHEDEKTNPYDEISEFSTTTVENPYETVPYHK